MTINDIKNINISNHHYFEIKENAYFMLSRQITAHSKQSPFEKGKKV